MTVPPGDAASMHDPVTRHLREMRLRHRAVTRYFAEAEAHIETQWETIIRPRLESMSIDWSSVVEIACGHGRNTARLLQRVRETRPGGAGEAGGAGGAGGRMTIVDMQAHCLERCFVRFADDVRAGRLRCYVNDGRSLPMIEDAAATFVYTFDSMVHFHPDVVRGYIREIRRILRPGGMAFVHHSNLDEAMAGAGSSAAAAGAAGTDPGESGRWCDNPEWRAPMSRAVLAGMCREHGLTIMRHDALDWAGITGLDAIALLRREG